MMYDLILMTHTLASRISLFSFVHKNSKMDTVNEAYIELKRPFSIDIEIHYKKPKKLAKELIRPFGIDSLYLGVRAAA